MKIKIRNKDETCKEAMRNIDERLVCGRRSKMGKVRGQSSRDRRSPSSQVSPKHVTQNSNLKFDEAFSQQFFIVYYVLIHR